MFFKLLLISVIWGWLLPVLPLRCFFKKDGEFPGNHGSSVHSEEPVERNPGGVWGG